MIGEIFGRLTVMKKDGKKKDGTALWLVACTCGNERRVEKGSLTSGRTRSCGCLSKEVGRQRMTNNKYSTRHGQSESPTYHSWEKMISRCENKGNNRYDSYGGRGISVCARWKNSFEAFVEEDDRSAQARDQLVRKKRLYPLRGHKSWQRGRATWVCVPTKGGQSIGLTSMATTNRTTVVGQLRHNKPTIEGGQVCVGSQGSRESTFPPPNSAIDDQPSRSRRLVPSKSTMKRKNEK